MMTLRLRDRLTGRAPAYDLALGALVRAAGPDGALRAQEFLDQGLAVGQPRSFRAARSARRDARRAAVLLDGHRRAEAAEWCERVGIAPPIRVGERVA